MSDTSRGRVTITLGRSGQVVKRDLSASGASFSSSLPTVGTKRSLRDRIGHNADSSLWHENDRSNSKRQRGDISMRNGLDEGQISRDDLRLKLMRKSALRRTKGDGDTKRLMDLREKLSTTVQHPVTSRSSKQQMSDSETRMLGRIPSVRSSDDLMRMETMRSSYSPWTFNHMRQRSPDGFPGASRGISSQSNVKDLQRRPLNRAYDSARAVPYVTKDALETSRPPSTAPASLMAHSTVSTVPSITAKPIAPQLGQLPPPRNAAAAAAQRTSYMENGLEKNLEKFQISNFGRRAKYVKAMMLVSSLMKSGRRMWWKLKRTKDKIICLRRIVGRNNMNIISAYTPQVGAEAQLKEKFWKIWRGWSEACHLMKRFSLWGP